MKRHYITPSLVIISCLLFGLHQYFQMIAKISMPLFDNYLDPVLMMPILLYLLGWERKLLFRNVSMQLPENHIFGYFILAVIFGELILPFFNNKFTADYWDILSYALGSLSYVVTQRISSTDSLWSTN